MNPLPITMMYKSMRLLKLVEVEQNIQNVEEQNVEEQNVEE